MKEDKGLLTYIMAAIAALMIYIGSIAIGAENQYTIVVPNVITEGTVIPDTPVPTPTPTAVPPTAIPPTATAVVPSWNCTGNWQVDRWGPLVASVFPEWAVCDALFIIQHESRGDPDVYNFAGSGACGLFQLLPCESTDPYLNTLGAHRKWLDGGQDFWKHWRRWW